MKEGERCFNAVGNLRQQLIKVLLLESISQLAIDAFERKGYEVEALAKVNGEDLIKKISNVNIIGIRSKTKLTSEVLEAISTSGPVAIGCFCIGTDQTDLDAAAEKGIPVFNAPFANTRSVAEIVLSCIIGLARGLTDCSSAMHSGKWNKSAKNRFEVRGKTLGIIGYGHVGSQLSVLAEALGMRVIFHDIEQKMPLGNATPVGSKNEVLVESDFVSLHVPLNPTTVNLIGQPEIALMKKGRSFLINFSRGKCVDINALANALHSKHLLGAAVDVFPEEPAAGGPFSSPLQKCHNTILTPHIGGSTEEAQEAIGREVSEKLINFIETGNTCSAVNFPNVSLFLDGAKCKIMNVHRNVPGMLREINNALSDYNISAQVLGTQGKIGYMICQIDDDIAYEAYEKINALPNSIRTRILDRK